MEACDILRIKFEPPGSYFLSRDTEVLNARKYGPREEWALRWLLKNFQSADVEPGSLCVDFQAWLLLRELLVFTPMSNIARLLNAHNFTSTLQKTFNWLDKQVGYTTSLSICGSHEDAAAMADSSSATVEISPIDQPKKSRKRKRSETSALTRIDPKNDIERLYVSICSVIKQLNTLIGTSTEGSSDFATEHLKSAFRAPPEQAAKILGSALTVASLFLDNYETTMILGESADYLEVEGLNQHTRDIALVHEACIFAVANIWDSCSGISGGALDELSVHVFSAHTLLPLLHLLGRRKSLSTSSQNNMTLIHALEDLLVNNVILPARASFISSKSWKKAEGEDPTSLTAELVLRPLAEIPHAKSGEFTLVSSAGLESSAIPLLFSVAIRSLPRATPKQRSIEDSWLRHLLSQLEHCTHKLVSQIAPTLQSPQYTSTLNRMLREALDHKVRLDGSICEVTLARIVSISDKEFGVSDTPIYWTLIGLCLEIDANHFVTSSSVDKSSDGNPDTVQNRDLAAVLSQITNTDGQSTPYSDVDYNTKLLKVVLPLAEAFASARVLTAFLLHWEEQLTICQPRRSEDTANSGLSKIIWEDERLILLVGRLMESSLTPGQIEQVFQKIFTNLIPSESVDSEDHSGSMANLVILDCVVGGLAKKPSLKQLEQTIHSLYLSILGIVSSGSSWPSEQSWRLWRILTTLNERWPLLQTSITREEAEGLAMDEAAELIKHSVSAESTNVGQVYLKELHAFSFILSLASVQNIKTDIPRPETDRAASVIETILNYRQSFFDSMNLSLDEHPSSTQLIAQWDVQNERVLSVDVLLVGYIAQIITFPTVFSILKVDLQHRFFQQLYWSAVAFKKARQPETGFINYLSIWQTLLDSELLQENTAVATLFRNLQASTFLAASDFQESSRQIVDMENYELAFWGIQHTPARAFDRGQRNRILDGVLRSATSTNLTPSMILDHIGLLIEYIGFGNNPSRVLCVMQKDSTEEPPKRFPMEESSPLLELVRRLDLDHVSASKTPAMKALKRLAQSTLRRCISSISQEKIVECLASFYDRLLNAGTGAFETPLQHALTTILETSLSIYVHHMSEFPDSLRAKADGVKTLRQHHADFLRASLSRIHDDKSSIARPAVRSDMFVVLEGIISYSDLLTHPTLGEVLHQLSGISEALLQSVKLPTLEDDSVGSDHLLVQITRLETLLGVSSRDWRPAVLQATKALQILKSPSERNRLLHHLQRTIAEATEPEDRTELLGILVNIGKGEYLDDPERLLLLQQVFLAQEESKTRSEPCAIELAPTFTALCNGLVQSKDSRCRVLMMQCMSLLLRKEPRTISQWHIDSLLAAIAIVSARLVETNEEQSTGVAFLGLCRMFSLILAVHRMKLGGRYHLVVPALQGLLRCLFVSYPTSNATSTAGEHVSGLGNAHAAAYARLLTTICDPTVSAVTRSGKASRRGLTDETKKARSIAGQHLQYVIMEYCTCQLMGRLQPEVKAALASGLYAIVDVMPHEVMRTMNEAMDPSSRSIFKALYEEHGRFAKRQHM